MSRLTFLLGTHQPGWLHANTFPLFVSDRRLRLYRRLPVAAGPWALDSGGFTELATYGSWDHGPTPATYATQVRRYRDEIGRLMWAAPQDWMCEPFMLAKTGRTVAEHQARTVANLVALRALAPELPWIPVVQGWTVADYVACVARYADAGVDLTSEPLVGLGSVCRRQATGEAAHIVAELHAAGVTRLHGFGVKTAGLLRYGHLLVSSDSLAWSFDARRKPPLPGCEDRHRNCANCRTYANAWRASLLARLAAQPVQPTLWEAS
ncbi:MAG: DUF7221 family queuine tRNA-ribosyltransferase-like protein [Thermocrispum sp.]